MSQAEDTTLNMSTAVVTDRTRLQIPSQIEWIAPTLDLLRQRLQLVGSCDEVQLERLMLGLHEGLTNAVVHGNLEVPSALKEEGDAFARKLAERQADEKYNSRLVHIALDYDGNRYEWTITDEGPGFDVDKVLRRLDEDPENGFLASGRGILMMRAFFDTVCWEDDGRRVILRWKAPEEKRRNTRWPYYHKVRVAPMLTDGTVDWTAAVDAVTRNLSNGGSLVIHQSLTRAERVMIALDVEGTALCIPALVRRCTPHTNGMVEMGICFQTAQLTSDHSSEQKCGEAIDLLVESIRRQEHTDAERRQYPRVAYTEQIEIVASKSCPTLKGFAQDLSSGGIRFITTEEIPLEIRTLVLPQKTGEAIWIQAQVLRCIKITDTFYEVAAQFIGG